MHEKLYLLRSNHALIMTERALFRLIPRSRSFESQRLEEDHRRPGKTSRMYYPCFRLMIVAEQATCDSSRPAESRRNEVSQFWHFCDFLIFEIMLMKSLRNLTTTNYCWWKMNNTTIRAKFWNWHLCHSFSLENNMKFIYPIAML